MANARRVVLAALVCLVPLAIGAAKPAVVEVEGFRSSYKALDTPRADWGDEREQEWVLAFEGTLEAKKTLAYRKQTVPAGKHDVWAEKGKGDAFYLLVGNREKDDAPRLRAMFRLYEQDEGVEKLRFDLKLTRRGSKLKFSILAGRSEGHGNLRVVGDDPK